MIRINHKFIFIVFFVNMLAVAKGQDSTLNNSESIPYIRFQYSMLFPAGDFEDRYANSNVAGGAFGLKLKSGWTFEVEAGYHFSRRVKSRGLLDDILNEAGDATDSDGELVKVSLEQRGLSIYTSVGRLFHFESRNKNSGLLLQAGIGYFQHKIKIDYRDGDVFQLSEEMQKGYDRLHTGLALRQFIGYQHFGMKNLLNFYIGLEIQEAYTKNRRLYNYDTQQFDKGDKFDFLYGIKMGWAIPFKSRASEEFYYY